MKVGIGIIFCVAILAIILSVTVTAKDVNLEENEGKAREYMNNLDKNAALRKNEIALAEWAYASNVTDENEAVRLNTSLVNAQIDKTEWQETITYKWQDFQDFDLKRKFEKYAFLGSAALPNEKFEQLQKSISEMQSNYATAKICDYSNSSKCDLSLEPEITELLATSQNPEELKHIWVEWHKEAGAKVKDSFTEYVKLSNEAAQINNYSNNAEIWLREYEANDFEQQMKIIWDQMKPLYLQIHAYVRKNLHKKYGDAVLSRRGPIPAHLLGNMWAQQWNNIESFTRPYPDKPDIDITPNLIAQNYTALKMFQVSDEFFQSLNLTAMPPKFWENSIIEKPNDGRELICHASAWDFYDGEDFRVKQCTDINSIDFETVHHEMGHVQYFLQYKDMATMFRNGANPGFHEAVGDVMSLSVSTPKHLKKIGLLPDIPDDAQTEINHLYSKGIEKIVFLPFAYLLDLYRYAIFRGETTPDNYNCHFWKLREDLQGLEPPVPRTENDFDAAAKYHVSADVEYARYYVSFVIQFQFHKALCAEAGEYVPGDDTKKLTNCDIYQSTNAGNLLAKMLQMGSSRPWQDAMEVITGQRTMDASGLLEYFQPLMSWLKEDNERTGELIGWEPSVVQYCTDPQKAALKLKERSKVDSINK
ncbi:angiotensin-converting enzyme-like isoform X2 [Arctopsyche grandis]|uniref:angiotensin-converting enzyme-like isoform X2 n=1 Tax=Arctopsyche grandis TaxID=121162 RepID=UPI00406D794B